MTNEQQVQTGIKPREVIAAEPGLFSGVATFDEWLDRWEKNRDETTAIGLLHGLFGGSIRSEINRRVAFMIQLLQPLPRYDEEDEPWERIQLKGVSVLVAYLFKKREQDATSIGLAAMKNYPELVPAFLRMLAARQSSFDRPKFFFYDERDSSEKLIRSFLEECHRVLRGSGLEGRHISEYQALREALSAERETLYRLLIEHRLEKLCGMDHVRFMSRDSINDPELDLAALKAIALSEGWNGVPQKIADVLVEAGIERSLRQEAAIQYTIISAVISAQRRARRLAGRPRG